MSPQRLGQLFTGEQIDKLMSFCTTHRIPERLFNGDDVGATTAQQRILLSGHIIATGTYSPGSYDQEVHARMCGHWVNIVNHYAGVGEAVGRGGREQFDHTGGLSMSVSGTGSDVAGTRRDSRVGDSTGMGTRIQEPGQRSDFQMQALPIDSFDTVNSGDWLWIYNDNGPGGGNHSVIFSRWASGVQSHEADGVTVQYRRAVTMSQGSTRRGGRGELRYLGEGFVPFNGTSITPIVNIIRVDQTARPMASVRDLVAILGSGPDAAANARFVRRLSRRRRYRGQDFNWVFFTQYLREQNDLLISQLASRMTENQADVFRGTNQSAEAGDLAAEVSLLVRLNRRLTILVTNSDRLEQGSERHREGVESRRRAAENDESAQRRRDALQAQIGELSEEIETLEAAQNPVRVRHERFAAEGRELRTLTSERRQQRRLRTNLRDQQRLANHTPDSRKAINSQIDAISRHLVDLQRRINDLTTRRSGRANRAERRDARRSARQGDRAIQRKQRRLDQLERRLADLTTAATGYELVHGGVSGRHFQGRGESRRLSGRMSGVRPRPDWSQFFHNSSTP